MTPANLQQLLPHRGDALWLHSIDDHDEHSIRGSCNVDCLHQLHAEDTLLLFEAAAQLCAAHGGLYADDNSIDGAYIGKISGVRLHAPLKPKHGLLQVQATRLGHSTSSALYRFDIYQQQHLLLDGQLLVVLGHA